MLPPAIEELGRAVGRALPGEGGGVDLVEIAGEAGGLGVGTGRAVPHGRAARAEEAIVAIAEEVVPERRRVEERLEHGVHEAGVAEVVEPA